VQRVQLLFATGNRLANHYDFAHWNNKVEFKATREKTMKEIE
jgi:hypothetical protein